MTDLPVDDGTPLPTLTDEDRRQADDDRRRLLARPGGRRATDPPEDPATLLARAALETDVAERLLEIAAVAKRLKRCPETVRRYIRAGLLRATRPPNLDGSRGGNYLIPESAVREFLTTLTNITPHRGA